MPDLAIIVPTRGRPGNIERVIGAWDFTNAWDVADLVLVVDADDPELPGYHQVTNEVLDNVPDGAADPIRLIEMPHWLPMVEKLNAAAVALADDYFALGFAGDDHLPQTIDWAKTYLAELRKLGTGMVYGDDGYQGKNLSTEWAVTADAVRALGRMVPAPVEHMYCDNSMMDVFGAAQAMKHLPQIRIEHLHPVAGKAESDEQYRRVNHRSQFAKDQSTYKDWQRRDMAGQIAKIVALRPDRPGAPRKDKRMNRSPFPRHFKQVPGLTPEEIGVTIADFAIGVPADEAIVELGVHKGKTALQLAWGASQGNGAHVWAIDPWDSEGNVYVTSGQVPHLSDLAGVRKWAHYWISNLGYSDKITLVQGFSQDVARDWNSGTDGRKVGLFYVDGDHTYEGARRDIETWAPHLADGAVIAIDDYVNENYPGVRQAIDDLVTEGMLAPLEIYHDRLAVTRLAKSSGPAAITGEGVSPSPVAAGKGETYETGRAVTVDLGAAPDTVTDDFDTALSNTPDIHRHREVVSSGELDGVTNGTPIGELTLPQLKALAKSRGITLGARKDKKADTVQALLDGQ